MKFKSVVFIQYLFHVFFWFRSSYNVPEINYRRINSGYLTYNVFQLDVVFIYQTISLRTFLHKNNQVKVFSEYTSLVFFPIY